MISSRLGFGGELVARKIRPRKASILWKISNFPNVWCGLWRHALARACKMNHMLGELRIMHFKRTGEVVDYGLVSTALVTTQFVTFVVDQLQTETSVFGDFKYHDSGVGTTAAAIGDTDIETTDGESRATGTQTETSTTVYSSVGTISYTTTKAITEHGLFNVSTSNPVLMDRHVFSAINVVNGDSIQYSFSLTVAAGG